MFHFMLCLGSMFDLLAGDLIRNLSRLHLQGTKALPLPTVAIEVRPWRSEGISANVSLRARTRHYV